MSAATSPSGPSYTAPPLCTAEDDTLSVGHTERVDLSDDGNSPLLEIGPSRMVPESEAATDFQPGEPRTPSGSPPSPVNGPSVVPEGLTLDHIARSMKQEKRRPELEKRAAPRTQRHHPEERRRQDNSLQLDRRRDDLGRDRRRERSPTRDPRRRDDDRRRPPPRDRDYRRSPPRPQHPRDVNDRSQAVHDRRKSDRSPDHKKQRREGKGKPTVGALDAQLDAYRQQ